jgi:hypothetical protein
MFASSIGKLFIKEYNRRNNTSYSAKEFFEREFYPLFYDHPKYMQWITNSPFVQGIRKGSYPTSEERKEKLDRLKEKLQSQQADASIAIGYPSLDEMATTSGQITNLNLPFSDEDYYASWLGGGLGVGVQGGYSIYFDQPEILYKIYEGWNLYRRFLNEYDNLRPNQIETWNGQWLSHVLSEDYNPNELFAPFEIAVSGSYKGLLEVATQRWTEILIAIATVSSVRILNGYIFNLGKTNTTIGFIPFQLPEIRKPVQFYIELFGENEYLNNAKLIRSLYGTAFGFVTACQMGVIGVRALEPKDLHTYIADPHKKGKLPNYEKADDKQNISFKTYQTWLLAMLDNKQLWDIAGKAADNLINYEKGAGKVRTDRSNDVKTLLSSNQQKAFISALTTLVQKGNDIKDLVELAEIVNSKLHESNVPYFITLLRFRYAEKSK